METIGAVVDCVAALGLGLILGFRWTLGQPGGVLAGAVIGEICAAVYFVFAIWVGRHWPNALDARLVGLHFMALVVLVDVSGGVGAWFGYRKSLSGGLFRDRGFP